MTAGIAIGSQDFHCSRFGTLAALARLKRKFLSSRWKIETATAKMPGDKCGEPNHQPLLKLERLKENLLHQLERFTKRFEDFDFRLRSIHERDFDSLRPKQSSAL